MWIDGHKRKKNRELMLYILCFEDEKRKGSLGVINNVGIHNSCRRLKWDWHELIKDIWFWMSIGIAAVWLQKIIIFPISTYGTHVNKGKLKGLGLNKKSSILFLLK